MGAEILGQDRFDYVDGSELVGLDGGMSWDAAWTSAVASAETTIQDAALQVGTGSELTDDPNLISRKFGYYSGDTLFFSVKLSAMQNYNSGDFFILWLDTGNTSTSHNTINVGFDLSGNVMARINNGEGNNITYGPVVEGAEYTLVIKLTKSVSGSANNYDSMCFWVNPLPEDSETPDGSLTLDTGRHGFSWVGVRSVNTEPQDVLNIDNLVLGTEWDDVFTNVGFMFQLILAIQRWL